MSCSITTNGSALGEALLPAVEGLKWIRFSINGGDEQTYSEVHGVASDVFDRVLGNIGRCVDFKRGHGLPVTVGTQLVLLEENASGVTRLGRLLRDLGVDYFSVKPYSQHPLSHQRLTVDYSSFGGLKEEVEALETDSFRVEYRADSMMRAGTGKAYETCYGTDFMGFMSAAGDIWECNVFAGDPRFLIGNLTDKSFGDIWRGERRESVRRWIRSQHDLGECRDLCRMDACNRYLWRLHNSAPHDDFI